MARTRNVPRTPILRSGLMAVHLARLAVTVDLPTPPFPIHHSYYYRVSELGQPFSKKYGFSKIAMLLYTYSSYKPIDCRTFIWKF